MMKAVVSPGLLHGEVTPPPSKSLMHRAVICAALSKGRSVITPYYPSDDINTTIGAMRALGAEIEIDGNSVIVDADKESHINNIRINCGESGSTMRFLIPVTAAMGVSCTFTGEGRLPERPIGTYLDLMPQHGVLCDAQNGGLPLKINGQLMPGNFEIAGNVSSQFITGLLLALPLLSGDSRIILTSPLESSGYVDITLSVLNDFGIKIEKSAERYGGFYIKGGQTYHSRNVNVESDWSQAAFWLAAGALGSDIGCNGLKLDSLQGDKAVAEFLCRFGAELCAGEENSGVKKRGPLCGTNIDASQIPDLVPILAVVAAMSKGKTKIFNASRLRLKESDRLHTTALNLSALGADITEEQNALIISGVPQLRGGVELSGFNDHRIVMACAVAALSCREPVTIRGAECINKSYPEFFKHLEMLGGKVNVFNVG